MCALLRTILVLSWLAAGPAAAAELVMFEEAGCAWCARWDAQVGAVYDKTDEARRAPLRRVGLHDPRPADLPAIEGVVFTPTFVLVDRGREVGRIVGYPGESFFWEMLGALLEELDAVPEP
jgi:hypothetical protein